MKEGERQTQPQRVGFGHSAALFHDTPSRAMETCRDAGTIPARLFSSIIPNLITVLEHTRSAEGVVTLQAKQALLQAVCGLT